MKKNPTPTINQPCRMYVLDSSTSLPSCLIGLTLSFTANPNGTITFTIIRPAFFKDETLGTLVINTNSLADGVPQEKDFELTHEPKNKTKTKGTIKLKLHYPKSEAAPVQQSNKPKSIQDVYTIGDEIGRYGG